MCQHVNTAPGHIFFNFSTFPKSLNDTLDITYVPWPSLDIMPAESQTDDRVYRAAALVGRAAACLTSR